jgi:hypothetical protein
MSEEGDKGKKGRVHCGKRECVTTNLERIITISLDALVDGKEIQVEAIVVSPVQEGEDVCEDGRVWSMSVGS